MACWFGWDSCGGGKLFSNISGGSMGGWVGGVCKTSDRPCNCRLTCNNVREEYSDFFIWVHKRDLLTT